MRAGFIVVAAASAMMLIIADAHAEQQCAWSRDCQVIYSGNTANYHDGDMTPNGIAALCKRGKGFVRFRDDSLAILSCGPFFYNNVGAYIGDAPVEILR